MTAQYSPRNFLENIRGALADGHLRGALTSVTKRLTDHRAEAFAELPDGDALRDYGKKLKDHVLANLDTYLLEFERQIQMRGGHVHWAADAEEAGKMILGIAKNGGARSVIKSKSMTTEEVELNHVFERAGIDVVETDFGEYIIQVAKEKPSHIIIPAIHKNRYDVGKLFHEKLGQPYEEDIPKLTAMARRLLRDKFAKADMGVTSANFAVARTGQIVLVENEGNIRMAGTLPGIHVALVGFEKLIPGPEHIAPMLRLLTRSATGQKISSYVSVFAPPRRQGDKDGPKEFHIVLLDNGRSAMFEDPRFREALRCIRCGACLNVCPVYQKIGGHAYGWVYPGPIGKVITPKLLGMTEAGKLPGASSLCGACKDVCPVKINLPDLILANRADAREEKTSGNINATDGGFEGWAFKLWLWLMKRPSWFNRVGRLNAKILPWLDKKGLLRLGAPALLQNWMQGRELPAMPEQSFRDWWKKNKGRNA